MYKLLLAGIFGTLFTTSASAAEATRPADWSGFSLEALLSGQSGKNVWTGDGDYRLKSAAFGGLRVGYDRQDGDVVLGARLSAQFGSMHEKAYPAFEYKAFYDLNARAGYAFGDFLAYVTAGYSLSGIEENGVSYTRDGFNYGVGVQKQLTPSVTIGLEYLRREFSANCKPHGDEFKQRINSVQASVGYRF